MTLVYLIRHGATAANREVPYRLQGSKLDLPLDEVGTRQVQAAAMALRDVKFSAVYASPLLRARNTAEIVAFPLGLETQIVPGLIEADLGRWEGLTWDQARAQDPAHHKDFHAHPGTVPYPDGESFLDVQNRITPLIARLAAQHEEEGAAAIAVIGHNVTCRSYLAGLMNIPIDHARAIRQSNGGINLIRFEAEKAQVVMVNGCLHLRPEWLN